MNFLKIGKSWEVGDVWVWGLGVDTPCPLGLDFFETREKFVVKGEVWGWGLGV
jgi:hypothetical protein